MVYGDQEIADCPTRSHCRCADC